MRLNLIGHGAHLSGVGMLAKKRARITTHIGHGEIIRPSKKMPAGPQAAIRKYCKTSAKCLTGEVKERTVLCVKAEDACG